MTPSNPAAVALASCINAWWLRVRPNSGDCRVVLPAPTTLVARCLHQALIELELPSYLVTSGGKGSPLPSKMDRVLRAEAVTSIRDGSFVVVVEPGVLSKLQESIQGSGGGIRSLAIPDEWPWTNADAGFDFFGDFLPVWMKASGYPDTEGSAAAHMLRLAIAATEPMKNRASVFFDEILSQRFDPAALASVRADAFSMCVGVPSLNAPSISGPGVPAAGVNELTRVEELAEAMQGANARVAVTQNGQDALLELPECDRIELTEFVRILNDVLDGMRTSKDRGRGALALRRALPSEVGKWRLLTIEVLRRVFIQQPAAAALTLSAAWGVDEERAHVLRGGLHCIAASAPLPPLRVLVGRQAGTGAVVEAKAGKKRLASISLEPGQNEATLEIDWDLVQEVSTTITLTATAIDLPRAVVKLYLEKTSDAIPDFLIVAASARDLSGTKSFRRINPSNEDEQDESVDIDGFTSILAVSANGAPVISLDGRSVLTETVARGVARLLVDQETVAAAGSPPELLLTNGEAQIHVTLAADGKRGGACNLEVALRLSLQNSVRGSDAIGLLDAWRADFDAGPMLGSADEEHEKRFKLVSQSFELDFEPWRPVVVSPHANPSISLAQHGWIRVSADGSSEIGPGFRSTDSLSPRAMELIERYAIARASVFDLIKSRHGRRSRNGLPLYAAASFDSEEGGEFDAAASGYLDAFDSVQRALETQGLSYVERFILAFLDVVVVTNRDGDGWQVIGTAIGPWHPLVVAKRMMVGRGLRRLAEFPTDLENRWLRKLGVLLKDVAGIRWFAGLRADAAQAVPFFVDATDDPGWLVAKPATDIVGASSADSLGWERSLFGLGVLRGGGTEARGFVGYLSDYFRAFSSRRSIVVKASADTPAWEAAAAARAFLTNPDGQPTSFGAVLQGGVHIVVDGEGGRPEDYPEWDEPVVSVYPRGGEGFLREHKVDMLLMEAASNLAFPVQSPQDAQRSAPRGIGAASVLQLPLRTLEQTGAGVRDSRLSYNTRPVSRPPGLGGAFVAAASSAQIAAGSSRAVGVRTLSPEFGKAAATWTVLPGEGADPAVLLDWARSTSSSGAPKVLWDYRMAITQSFRTYFVLSEVPRMLVHHIAGSAVFANHDRAGKALMELADIGLALGSEAFKSRSRALGVVGLVGAARVSQSILSNACKAADECCDFLLPIDSFRDLLGGDLETALDGGQADYRRGDLVGVACRISSGGVELAFCAVESKFCSGTFSESRAKAALEQAARSLQRLVDLAQAAREAGALAERLALSRLLEFGLRLRADRKLETIEAILTSVLRGEHRASIIGKTGCIVVSTEIELACSAVCDLAEGAWVRLAPSQWPNEKGAEAFSEVASLISAITTAPWNERAGALAPMPSPAGEAEHPVQAAAAPASPPERGMHESSQSTQPPNPTPLPAIDANVDSGPSTGGSGGPPAGLPSVQVGVSAVELLLGVTENGKPVRWRAGENSNHNFMVTGSSGLGKTQLLKSVLWQARQQGLPALILDFKNDFASDREFLSRASLDVQYVGFDGLPYNPLIPCPQLDPRTGNQVYMLSQHVNGIVAAFQRTYGLGEQQAADLRDAIRAALDAIGVASTGVVHEIPDEFPDFAVVGEYLRDRNRLAYNRLDPLFDLEMFRDKYRSVSFNHLLGRGYVLDLSGIQAEHIQNTLAALLVYSAHRYLNALPHAASFNQLLVFDEAHRVLKSEDVDKLVRECRAYGLGVILSSQYPTDFPADTAANLASKVLHGNGPDVARVQAIRSMLGLQPDVDKRLNLPMFQAVTLAKPGQVVFTRTIGYPHRILMEALRGGPVSKDVLKLVKGLHGDKFEQTLQHLVEMQLVQFSGDKVGLAV